uniref:Lipoprotein n=1 Tax=Parascaris univalens TaxID=6257 RepID=A0A915CLL2_PARUN
MFAVLVDMVITCAIPLCLGVFLFAVCCVDNPLGYGDVVVR